MTKPFNAPQAPANPRWLVPLHLCVGALLGVAFAAALAYPQSLTVHPHLLRAALFGVIAASVTSLLHMLYRSRSRSNVARRPPR